MIPTAWSTPSTGATPDFSMRLPSDLFVRAAQTPKLPSTRRTRVCHLPQRKATPMRLITVTLTALAFTGTAAAQWTPQKHGDPRTCPGHTASECATAAATFAFKAKYVRVTGHAFANTLKCSTSGSVLSYMCAWGTPANQTPVRFAHKAAGWKVAVGVIAP